MKTNTKKVLAILIPCALMAVIFCFSSQPGVQSHGFSTLLLRRVLHMPLLRDLIIRFSSDQDDNIRKMAHIVLYFLLGAAVTAATRLLLREKSGGIRHPALLLFLIPIAVCFLFGCTDEFHQLFVAGRGAKFSDVGIDAIGFLPGILLTLTLTDNGARQKE